MRSTSVTGPDGVRWLVRRRWLPWEPRWRGPRRERSEEGGSWFDLLDLAHPLLDFDEGLGGFAFVLGLIVLFVTALLFVLPFFAFVVELVLVGCTVIGTIAYRIIFRRPWVVEATPSDIRRPPFLWKVSGFRPSGQLVTEIADQLRAGVQTPVAPYAEPIPLPREAEGR